MTTELCTHCLQFRDPSCFSKWYAYTTAGKPKRCDRCICASGKSVVENRLREIEVSKKQTDRSITQSQINLSKSDISKNKVETRRRIEELREMKLINGEYEL